MFDHSAVRETSIEGAKLLFRGKVRDVYDLGDRLLIVATDRISAFDSVFREPIPDKGKILTQISNMWFERLEHVTQGHLLETDVKKFPEPLKQQAKTLAHRSVIVKKAERIDIECVARGYLAGSAKASYKKDKMICGIKLPDGIKVAGKLPEPIFTPATKAASGHDENISFEKCREIVGEETANEIKSKTLELYTEAAKYAETKGLILADTKFEFGKVDGKIIVIDEMLTPDSSRFWDREAHKPGEEPVSFDKQFLREYLIESGWNREPPPPALPKDIIEKTRERYLEAYRRLVG